MTANSENFEEVTRAIFQRLREQFGFDRIEGSQHYPARDSGVKRQVDITAYSLDGKRIIIECKLHKSPIDIKYVDAFHTVIYTDVGADGGIIVSSHKFTRGAVKSAQAKKITLATLNEDATEIDFIFQIGELIFRGISLGDVIFRGVSRFIPMRLNLSLGDSEIKTGDQ
jgi:predicted helicase